MNPPPPAEGLASRLFLGPALRTQPDRRLVRLVRDGYETAFEEIVRRYGKALGHYAAAIVGGRSEDVTQDAFSKALLALRRDSDAEIELRPWLYRIVRNTALNDLRDRPPEPAMLAAALEGGSRSAAEEAERREELSELLERLRALPDPQRAAIVMRELEGLGHEEIAAALGMSGGAARQVIYRARQALRDGAGMLIPLPLVRALIDHGAEAGVAAGAGGAVAAGGAIGGAGAGSALKVGAITAAVLAGGLGTGLALKDGPPQRGTETAAAAAVRTGGATSSPSAPSSSAGRSSATALGTGTSAAESEGPGGSGDGSVQSGSDGKLARGDDIGGGSAGQDPAGSSDGHHQGSSQGGSFGTGPAEGPMVQSGNSGPGSGGGGPGPSGGHHGDGGMRDGGGGSDGFVIPPPPPPPVEEAASGSSSGSGDGSGTDGSGSGGGGSGPG
jgi:RNA polymerase sigma factor (sigma-70 family)